MAFSNFLAHFWTIAPALRHDVFPLEASTARPWSIEISDPAVGPVRLTGLLREPAGAETCLVVIHGLGGSADRYYCLWADRAAERRGWACLRLALRGADRSGADFYHAGLIADVAAAVESPELCRYQRLFLLGYSMGGHVALRYGAEGPNSRLRAAAAVCSPLDLDATANFFDTRVSVFYRRYVLRGLREIYEAVADRRPVPTPVDRVRRVRTIREWDRATVVPRFGFASVADYYASQSVAPHLGRIATPCLVVANWNDPIVPAATTRDILRAAPNGVEARYIETGGHVGFPRTASLGLPGPKGLENQILTWLDWH